AEEIYYSCFAFDRGRYRLSSEQPGTEERVRFGAHPWGLVAEGVRRKYGFERLVERVGPPETVLTPTTALGPVLDEGGFSSAERASAELIDGERSLAEVQLGAVGAPLGEPELYALAWSLVAIGVARADVDAAAASAEPLSQPQAEGGAEVERRGRPRPTER